MDIGCAQLTQIARLASKSEVQDPEVHGHWRRFIPWKVQGPIMTSTARHRRVVGLGVNDSGEEEGPVAEVEGVEVEGVKDALDGEES